MMYIQKLFRSSVLRFAPKELIPPFHYRKVTSFIGTTTGSLAAEIRTFAERAMEVIGNPEAACHVRRQKLKLVVEPTRRTIHHHLDCLRRRRQRRRRLSIVDSTN